MTTEATPPPVLVGGVVTLSDVDLYQNCTTSIEQTCDVSVVIGTCIPEMIPIVLNETEVSTATLDLAGCIRHRSRNGGGGGGGGGGGQEGPPPNI